MISVELFREHYQISYLCSFVGIIFYLYRYFCTGVYASGLSYLSSIFDPFYFIYLFIYLNIHHE